ncbi:ubiquitin-hydrolase Zn-finger-containing protein [Luteibacter rhizovicinus]|uniref:Ubiquitin-hydrolase Zn-finger-containing protein n=1 Tax=Luteibacter rhizovicinus TaxID=242606 RepID=A0A4R3YX00_9GAMM|nr:UBP-type zinc finger domain-containing protein [Luteibacter rhizovicinus]TCV97695.1 ubiquitin-hydrolase Zn-finger-containing protein [Luteibacter rhizovicinus]
MTNDYDGIARNSKPSGTGCVECLSTGAWWLHLRRCAECGHIGCCDTSPNQHATKHFEATGHPVLTSFEPGEDWFYDYRTGEFFDSPPLLPPHAHPPGQPVPGPDGKVPVNWENFLHD